MGKKRQAPDESKVPPETQEETKALMEQAFGLFSDHLKQITDNLRDFNQRKQEARERIKRGASRNDGRIV